VEVERGFGSFREILPLLQGKSPLSPSTAEIANNLGFSLPFRQDSPSSPSSDGGISQLRNRSRQSFVGSLYALKYIFYPVFFR